MKTLKTMVLVVKVALVKVAYQWDLTVALVKPFRSGLEARQNAKLMHDLCMAELEEEALKLL